MEEILRGRRILITRTRSQASSLALELERLGASPIILPTIEIVPPSSFRELDCVLSNLDAFDWLLFTSANAVQAFVQRVRNFSLPLRLPHIAVIGPATERALRDASVFPGSHPILVPPVAVAEALAETLLPQIKRLLANGHSANVALLRAEVARDYLPETLATAGASVRVAPAYRNVLATDSIVLLEQSLQNPLEAPDVITFTSSSTATNFVDLLQATGLPMPEQMRRVSIGPITSATLRELKLPPHTEADAATIPSLVTAIRQALSS